jgi:hypothetical protein
MAIQKASQEVNQFNRGLVTDANPLFFPENAALDENNMVLNRNGFRHRRLGMDYQNGSVEITTSKIADGTDIAMTNFTWKNAGGDAEKLIFVIQVGSELKFFDLDEQSVTKNLIYTYNFTNIANTIRCSYSVVDGILVVVNGAENIFSFTYDVVTELISVETSRQP